MDPNERKYETVTARRLALTDKEWKREGQIIREADERDGTLDFIEAIFDDAMKDEPDYEW